MRGWILVSISVIFTANQKLSEGLDSCKHFCNLLLILPRRFITVAFYTFVHLLLSGGLSGKLGS